MVEAASEQVDEHRLHEIADRIRRHPQLAQEIQVSILAQEVALRWREHSDMLQASEEVPVAAWIVRKKVEGLIRPIEEDAPEAGFKPDDRAPWIHEAVQGLQAGLNQSSQHWARPATPISRPPAPVKNPTPWKLAWSYPVLRAREVPPPRVVARESEPLSDHINQLLARLAQHDGSMALQKSWMGRPRGEWVAQFLAAVHLWHQRRVDAWQDEPFGTVTICHAEQEGAPNG